MSNKLQVHSRSAFYHLPICCGFCGKEVIAHEEQMAEAPTPCNHTIFVAHTEGIEYLAERAKKQILDKGYVVEGDGLLEIHLATDEEESVYPSELGEVLEFPDGIIIESHVGAPSGMSTYVGFAPLESE